MLNDFATIAEAVAGMGALHPTRTFVFQDMKGVETVYPFAKIDDDTLRRAAGLQALGLSKGDTFGLIVLDPEDFILTFLAATRMGAVPVPLYPPLSFGSLDAYADRTARILANADAKLLIASERLQNVLWGLVDAIPTCRRLVTVEALDRSSASPTLPSIAPDDLCFLQYTSGSTSDPKGVLVTHGNLVANTQAIFARLGVDPSFHTAVSWLPLYHDMGLIGHVLTPVVGTFSAVFIPTMRFIRRPMCWLEAISKHNGGVSFAPNFAYALVAKRAKPEDVAKLDLSTMRTFGCGAEPIHADTVERFIETFRPAGLDAQAFLPAYGMAEATLAMTFKPQGQRYGVNVVDANHFQAAGRVVEPAADDVAAAVHVSCGTALPGHEVGVFSDDGERLADGVEGELCFRGPSVTPGYLKNPEATAAARRGDWLRTGDLGYMIGEDVFVTGRLKDLIILNGRNIHPQTVEWAAAEVPGVRKGNVVAFSVPGATSEDLVLVLEAEAEGQAELLEAIKRHIQQEHGLVVADIVCVGKGQLPKTSSGKVQRRGTRHLYLTGQIGQTGPRTLGAQADRVTLARHVARSLWSRAKATVLRR